MVPAVVRVCPLRDYLLHVEFDNGESGVLDIEKLLDWGPFRPLRDPDVFRRVRVSFDTLEWEAGVDLPPEFVYRNVVASNR